MDVLHHAWPSRSGPGEKSAKRSSRKPLMNCPDREAKAELRMKSGAIGRGALTFLGIDSFTAPQADKTVA
jgi:hypothetical protein